MRRHRARAGLVKIRHPRAPAVDIALDLLDDGARQAGYYHVRLPDRRSGWVYSTFAAREAGAAVPANVGPNGMAVHYVNIDRGAAALLEFSCGAVMIDTGGRGDAASGHLIGYLIAFFARRPDPNRRIAAIFITHTHLDHNVNLEKVAQSFQVGGCVYSGMLTGSGRIAANWARIAGKSCMGRPTAAVTAGEVASQAISGEVSCPP